MATYSPKPVIKNSNSEAGFTLVEIIIVFSIIAIISTVGLASFSDFSKSQSLQIATSDFVTTLNLAKSRASSQVKPDSCDDPLDGYKIGFCKLSNGFDCPSIASPTSYDYALYAVCGTKSISISTKALPSDVTFSEGIPTSISFPVIRGGISGVSASGTTVTLNGYGSRTKTVKLYSDGRITTQ